MLNLASVQAAAADQDWSLVNTCLAELSLAKANATEQSQILELALLVLSSEDFQDGWAVTKILPALGDIAIEPLLKMLQDNEIEPDVQWLVGKILGEFRSPIVATGLAQCLIQNSDSAELAEIALRALIQMGDVAIEQLTTLLKTNKLAAVTALAQIRHSPTIPPLLTVVDDSDPQIRYIALEALSSFHDAQVPSLLIQKLTDVSSAVRRAAVTGLGLRADLHVKLQLVKKIQPLLFDCNLEVCLATAIALGRFGDELATQALFDCYQQSTCPQPLQKQIVRCLGWIDQPLALQYLENILRTAPLTLIPEIIRALGQGQNLYAVKILTEYLRIMPSDYPAQIKQEIACSLGNFPKTVAVEQVIKLLADQSEAVRWQAVYCLKQFDRTVIGEKLQQLECSDPLLLVGIKQFLSTEAENENKPFIW
jgi:HEAT repeat protein